MSDQTLQYITLGLGVLVAIEQVLANIPNVKANSTFQLVCNLTSSLVGLFQKKPAEPQQ